MKVDCFTHSLQTGWSVDRFPELDAPNTWVIVFGAPEYRNNPAALEELSSVFPQSVKTGCSTAGEIVGASIQDASLSVSVVQFEQSEIKRVSSPVSAGSSYRSGQSIAGQLTQRPGLTSVFVLSEGIDINGTELVRGLEDGVGESVLISGGLAGDGDRFEQTWTWTGEQLQTGNVIAVGFYGDALKFGHGSYGGWDAFGPERLVTRAQGNVLYTLDGQPALELYKRYLGEYADELPSSGLLFPLAIRNTRSDNERTVRTILAIDEEQQSITFAGTIPENWHAQLMHANFENLIDGAHKAANQIAFSSMSSKHGILIGVSCVGRRLLLGVRAEEELEAVLETIPGMPCFCGFYSYGEISPNISQVGCSLRNQTMTLTYLTE